MFGSTPAVDRCEQGEILFFHPARLPTINPPVQAIASYLLSLLPTGTSDQASVESTLQAASALIDIYSDETVPYDINFRENNILGKLVDAVEPIRKLVRGINKKKPGGIELKRRGEEVRDNLVEFIKYRRGLRL